MRYFVARSKIIKVPDTTEKTHLDSLYKSFQYDGLLEVDIKGALVAESYEIVPYEEVQKENRA